MAIERPDSAEQSKRVCVGEVTGAHGLDGAFCVRSFTTNPEAFVAYGPLSREDGRPLPAVRVVGQKKGALIARAAGLEDRSAAEELRGVRLFVSRSALPQPDEDEYYHADLIGLTALLAAGGAAGHALLGRVVAVHDFGAGPVLEIARGGAATLMVPFSKLAVPDVDPAAGSLVVAPLPGLLAPSDRALAGGDEGEAA
jgi:16S rRNA processing protein RimM